MSFLPALSAVAGIAGTAMSAFGAIQQGRQQAAAANQQAQMAEFQQKQLDIKANEEFAAAQQEGFQLKRNKELALSTAQTRGAKSGFMPDWKNAEETEAYGTLQQQMAQYGGASRQQGLREQAKLTGMQADDLRNAANQYQTAGMVGGATAALSGLSDLGLQYSGYSGNNSYARRTARDPWAGTRAPSTMARRFG